MTRSTPIRLRYTTQSLFALTLLLALALSTPHWVPRSQTLSHNKTVVGYYTGLGLSEGPGYLGKNWYRMVHHESRDDPSLLDGYWEMDINGLGYNSYRGYYATGVLREEGRCMVVVNGSEVRPVRLDIQRAKFYDTTGKLISEIKNGSGQLILCFSNGNPFLQIDFIDGEMVHVKRWHRNGQLYAEIPCRHGMEHGSLVKYFPSGQIECHGELIDGKRVGVWKQYTENGAVVSAIDHGAQTLGP